MRDKVMVGDRKFDIIGAKANGLDVIGVTYGYGEREELEALAPTAIVSSVEELRRLLLG
ncbi:MAG: HAD hydrolase-like protein [Limnochordia bacterium]|nr:HAD hydrolase-like protein [Limnochordia bacterium]